MDTTPNGTPPAVSPGADPPSGGGSDTLTAQDGREVPVPFVAAVWTVRNGDGADVVACLYPVTLRACGSYAEARAWQERIQSWLDERRS